ncbi:MULTISPECIES: response regulator [unclassified Candidatus Frackibacter]|uniref:response regulator n=1 Tax=unclassified Candidatus Frackibacter TaxID=2648818 RepID=UPI00079948C8|nr:MULTISPECIES: response regulator [unclassified Candidatus Frackibacter]KXS40611.1 MAG: two-component system, chemotaxis family, response regulator CheY [Candidatus Frackibacter sp. T328-2]SDB99388.1 two-component system, chemotaxis family, response regulator CheY [Candidatus Frackibacter sp. WG11]SEM31036.1 two-component system, chemotaxis family, response regulator CheY [Candidatus Frackibacter sp. WG12]SFL36024.1 two-component system, chemotaxis family, response regulator CheY [Candidatus 
MKRTVLIADDAAFMRVMLKDILVEAGFEVVGEAENGIEAIELYKKYEPTLVTMDITMPDKDGITAVKEILNEDPTANILICSAMGQQAMVVEAIQAGAKDFVVKPFQAERVLGAVEKILD